MRRNAPELTAWAERLVSMYTPHPWKARAEGSDYGRKLGIVVWQEKDGRRVREKEFRPFPVSDLNDAEIEDRIRKILQDL